jgi:hypothetical protein
MIRGLPAEDYRSHPDFEYLYAITDDGQNHKIGITKNLKSRLSTLQTSHRKPLYITDVLTVPRGRARILEAHIHKDINYLKIRGEWFDISQEKIQSLFAFARIRWVEDALL